MATLKTLADLGYEVGVAFGDDDPDVTTVYVVQGFGVQTYLTEEDHETINALADEEGHAERVRQANEGPPEPEAVDLAATLRKQVSEAKTIDEVKDALEAVLGFVAPPPAE